MVRTVRPHARTAVCMYICECVGGRVCVLFVRVRTCVITLTLTHPPSDPHTLTPPIQMLP